METLKALLALIPGSSIITPSMMEKALDDSLIPDKQGRLPGTPGYRFNHDVYYAVYTLIWLIRAQPEVTTASSEGTSITTTPFDWDSFIMFLKANSVILSNQGVFTVIPIPAEDRIRRVDMSGGDPRGYDSDYL